MWSFSASAARLPWWLATSWENSARSASFQLAGVACGGAELRVAVARRLAAPWRPGGAAAVCTPQARACSRWLLLIAVAEQRCAFQQVAQFAHIARERLGLQQALRGSAQAARALRLQACQQGGTEQGNVVLAFAQGRQVDREGAQAVVQVFPEAALGQHGGQIAVRG